MSAPGRSELKIIVSEDGAYTKIEAIAGPQRFLRSIDFFSQIDAAKYIGRLFEEWTRSNAQPGGFAVQNYDDQGQPITTAEAVQRVGGSS